VRGTPLTYDSFHRTSRHRCRLSTRQEMSRPKGWITQKPRPKRHLRPSPTTFFGRN